MSNLLTTKPVSLMIGLLAFFGSCNNDALEIMQVGEQILETDFVPSSRFSGVYHDEKSGEEYIYLGNGRTEKKVSFFSVDGKYFKTIDFRKATESHSLNGISIWSLDSILLLSDYSGLLFFVDNEGECFKQININNLVPDTMLRLEFRSSKLDGFLHKKTIYLGIDLNPENFESLNNYERILKYNNKSLDLPHLIKIENIFDNVPQVSFLLNKFIANFIPKNHLALDIHHYLPFDDKIFLTSIIPDTLYILENDEQTLLKVFVDYKEKTESTDKLFKITKGSINNIQDNILWQTQRASYISRIHTDKKYKLKHLFAYHKFDGDIEDCWDKRNWSWLVYDENFNKLQEFVIKDDSVSPTLSFSTSKGVFIKVKPKYIKNYEPTKSHFKIYTVE